MAESQQEAKAEEKAETKKPAPRKRKSAKAGDPYPPHAEIASALQEPFPKELHERHYTGATYVSWPWYQQRLDDVVGPTNWWSEFVEERDDDGKLRRVEYTVWIRFPGDGEEVARTGFWELDTKEKWDIAHSKAFRRACVGHGIGRYLYDSSDFKSDDEMPEGYSGQQRGGRRQASGQRTGTRQNQGGQRRQSQQQQRKAQPQQQAAPPKQQAAAPPAETKPITKKQIETIEGAGAAFYGDDLWESKRLELIGKASGEENKTVNIDDLTFDQAEKLADRLDDGLTEFGSYSVFLDAQEAKRQEEEEKGDDALWE